MTNIFGRRYAIHIDNALFLSSDDRKDPLQIKFNVSGNFGGAIPLADISIINLSRDSINRLVALRGKPIELSAGYTDGFGPIFKGRIVNVESVRDGKGTEVRTTLYCFDGALESQSKLCIRTFAAGTRYAEIVDFVARDFFGVKPILIGFSEAFKESMGVALGGYSISVPHKYALNNLALDGKFEWFIKDSQVVLYELGADLGGVAVKISPNNGLVGGAELSEHGIILSVRLNTKLNIGTPVRIDSEAKSINFSSIYHVSLPKRKDPDKNFFDYDQIVKRISYNGDYYGDGGNSWTTTITTWPRGNKEFLPRAEDIINVR